MAALLLGSGAATDVADEWGATPVHRAVLRGHRDVAERLLDTGIADVNAEDRQGERPLHIASERGDYALAKLLLEHGGSATARTRTRATATECARERALAHRGAPRAPARLGVGARAGAHNDLTRHGPARSPLESKLFIGIVRLRC